jgi:hypothetical protein
MKTTIIAFAGRKQSGKTTCAEAVASRYLGSSSTGDARIYSFADPLKKDICMNILGLTYDQCYGSDDNKNELTNNYWDDKQLTAREVMQFVGTDVFRKMQKNVWAGATINKIMKEQPQLALIADCRFPNEVEAVKSAGGLVIKLNRNPYNSDHSSETALDANNYNYNNFDLVVSNEYMNILQQLNFIYSFLQYKGILPL